MGFSHKIAINCKDYPLEHFFHTSKELKMKAGVAIPLTSAYEHLLLSVK